MKEDASATQLAQDNNKAGKNRTINNGKIVSERRLVLDKTEKSMAK
jgi:hypothetical protein